MDAQWQQKAKNNGEPHLNSMTKVVLMPASFVEPNDNYLPSGYVDFRKSISGLLVIIEFELELSPFNDAKLIKLNHYQQIPVWFTGKRPCLINMVLN